MPLNSRLYAGKLSHARTGAVKHAFSYQVTYLFVDLHEWESGQLHAELAMLGTPVMRLKRSDYLPSDRRLIDEVQHQLQLHTGDQHDCATVFMLAMPRALGYEFNPIVLFYCYDGTGALHHVIAEVTNTPWSERVVYVVPVGDAARPQPQAPQERPLTMKSLHVSPFMPMNGQYRWSISDPGDHVNVTIELVRDHQSTFIARLNMRAYPLNNRSVLQLAAQPFRTVGAIYLEAIRLWRAGAVFHVHPRLRDQIVERFRQIDGGVTIKAPDRTYRIGQGSDEPLVIEVIDEAFFTNLALGGALGAAESFMAGHWRCDDLTRLMQLMVRNRKVLRDVNAASIKTPLYRIYHWLNRDTRAGSKRNIAAHYDLGNELFELFLDPTLNYSSAIFRSGEETLETAQTNKMKRLCERLALGPNDHLLEIGTGWGGLAIFAARHYGCRVTTTTISEAQYRFAKARIAAAGLDDRITLLKQDYRDLEGQFSKVVSVEMIEAVGLRYIPGYVRQCDALLEPGGKLMLQSITIADSEFEHARRNVDFIQRYIFPGGALPSVAGLTTLVPRHSKLQLTDLFDMTSDYAETLRRWHCAFVDNADAVRAAGYDERFERMWRYYLSYCEAGFMERHIGCYQLEFTKPATNGS